MYTAVNKIIRSVTFEDLDNEYDKINISNILYLIITTRIIVEQS